MTAERKGAMHVYNTGFFSLYRKEMPFMTAGMTSEGSMLGDMSQVHADRNHMFSIACAS